LTALPFKRLKRLLKHLTTWCESNSAGIYCSIRLGHWRQNFGYRKNTLYADLRYAASTTNPRYASMYTLPVQLSWRLLVRWSDNQFSLHSLRSPCSCNHLNIAFCETWLITDTNKDVVQQSSRLPTKHTLCCRRFQGQDCSQINVQRSITLLACATLLPLS